MKIDERVIATPCPDCEEEILLGVSAHAGDRVTCPNCWAALVIASLEPLELNWDIEEFDEDDWPEE
jgi:hypothetical protein